MGDMLLQNESNDLMMENSVDLPFFVDPNSQTLAEDEIRCRNQMVKFTRTVCRFSLVHLELIRYGSGVKLIVSIIRC